MAAQLIGMDKKKDQAMRPEDLTIKNADGTPYQVPVEGSLALLALGYKGLMAWRAARIRTAEDHKKQGK
ncbi:MAG: hypothetical protein H6594_06775 [Flavobacteriales bacterium]|nr:hypothetical protein [Flavobacteriales bacterium]